MTDNKFNPKKKVRITPPQPFIAPPPQEFTEEVRKIADEEAKKQISKYLTQNQTGQNWVGTIAEISDDLTQAQAPDGSIYSATSIGAQPGKFAPFFKIDNSRGVIYVPEADTYFVDSNNKKGYILQQGSDGIYLRQLGYANAIRLPVDVPQHVLDNTYRAIGVQIESTTKVQALFSANCKHILVGWWDQDQDIPWRTRASYVIIKGFELVYDEDQQPSLEIASTEAQTIDLNSLADNQAVPPLPDEPLASYIWYYGPGELVGPYARFFPVLSAHYETSVQPFTYPGFVGDITFSQTQQGHTTSTWILDPETLAVFNNVKFAFNNDEDGNPVVDIQAAFRGVTVGYYDSLTTYDEQTSLSLVPQPDGNTAIYSNLWSQNQEAVAFSYEYDQYYPYQTSTTGRYGRRFMDYTYEDLTDYSKTYVVTTGTTEGNGSGYELRVMTYKGNGDLPPCCFGADFDITQFIYTGVGATANASAVSCYLRTLPCLPFGFGAQTVTNELTTYDGVTQDTATVTRLAGPIPDAEAFWYGYSACCYLIAGYYVNYYWYQYSSASAFANAYVFVRGQMTLENVNNGMRVSFVGRPPTTENDYDLMQPPFRGISPNTTAQVYAQTDSLYGVGYSDPISDTSFLALIEILIESGFPEEAVLLILVPKYIYNFIPLTNYVYWYCGSYTSDPYYGYLAAPDVFSDRIFSPPETWPYQAIYKRAIDSYEVINYDQNNGAELIFLVSVAEDGLVSLGSIDNRPLLDNSGRTLLDVGMAYGPHSN